jgi:hypothetical protein
MIARCVESAIGLNQGEKQLVELLEILLSAVA